LIKNKNLRITGIVVAIVILIFWFSSKSGETSMKQSDTLLLKMRVVTLEEVTHKTPSYRHKTYIIRKVAHFLIYMSLGGCLSLGRKKNPIKVVIIIGSLALLDEFNQSFRGRDASLSDVILDVAGGFTGWAIVESVRYFFKNNKKEGES